jgi:hypothetical protein
MIQIGARAGTMPASNPRMNERFADEFDERGRQRRAFMKRLKSLRVAS